MLFRIHSFKLISLMYCTLPWKHTRASELLSGGCLAGVVKEMKTLSRKGRMGGVTETLGPRGGGSPERRGKRR